MGKLGNPTWEPEVKSSEQFECLNFRNCRESRFSIIDESNLYTHRKSPMHFQNNQNV